MKADFSEAGYQALVQEIFRRFPSVQKEGFSAGAYKPGLERQRAFEEALGHPSRQLRSIHIAGTNGKGSVANMLASAFTSCGLKTGLFTSPHLLDFRERMRSFVAEAPQDDSRIPKEYVFDFLQKWLPWCTQHGLSFFEITTGMAFRWFADQGVDAAVIETGLGGRLDSTNILERPELTLITGIGLDHMAQLGDTLPKIAAEKAGIFKADAPALVADWNPETAPVFAAAAGSIGAASLTFADQVRPTLWERKAEVLAAMDLQAEVQRVNLRTVLAAVDILRPRFPELGNAEALLHGITHTARDMDFHGRWQRLQAQPLVIADIGHNAHALAHNFAQLERSGRPLIIVYGIMADKDLDAILPLMPARAQYIFTTPDTPRALPGGEIARRRSEAGGTEPGRQEVAAVGTGPCQLVVEPVAAAVRKALELATPDTLIYIGGSTYVVAEALPLFARREGHGN